MTTNVSESTVGTVPGSAAAVNEAKRSPNMVISVPGAIGEVSPGVAAFTTRPAAITGVVEFGSTLPAISMKLRNVPSRVCASTRMRTRFDEDEGAQVRSQYPAVVEISGRMRSPLEKE